MQGRIPAIVYGRGRKPESLSISLTEFERNMMGSSGATIVDLSIGGKTVQTLVREVQKHPFRPGVLHVDFLEIQKGVKVTVSIPIHLQGIPEGVRTAGGVLDQSLREIEIEVLPKNIPSSIDLDVTDLVVGQSLHVSDINIPDATILSDERSTVCSVVPPRVEEEEAPEVTEELEEEGAEPELIRKPKAEDEGEAQEG
jgi:large subunit ribosomal protein L25